MEDKPQLRVFNLTLPANMAEEFYRLFPGQGDRSLVLRNIIREILITSKENKLLASEIIYRLRGVE